MPDYSLGRAHGKIEIDYDGSGADRAARDLDRTAKASSDADASLTKTNKTLRDTDRQFDSSGNSARGYGTRLREVRQASEDVERTEREYQRALRDSRSSVDEVSRAHRDLEHARERHTLATRAARDAEKDFINDLGIGRGVARGLMGMLTGLERDFSRLTSAQRETTTASSSAAKALGVAAKAAALLGPEGKAASGGLQLLSKGFDQVGSSAGSSGNHIANFVRQIAGFETAFGKIAGISLGVPSLGGLVGLGGASVLQGVVDVADAVRQLSGVLGLLPATVAGVGFSMGTLKIALHGVGDALKDMMADDPKKFLEDIANMAPSAAQSMLQVAQFRNLFLAGGSAIQESFFSKIVNDMQPLVQTWAPAVISAMSHVSGVFGDFAHQFAGLLAKPAAMQVFQMFVENISKGLQAMEPALRPLVNIFAKLTVEGSSFFAEIGGHITRFLSLFNQMLTRAQASGALHDWIQTGINAFGHLVHVVEQVGSAFTRIMTVADKFGGGGLLGWLDKVTAEFDKWAQGAEGQKTLTEFFSTLRTATDAFLPMLKPLVSGLASIGQAFAQLGVATAPGWQTFFDTFASTMAELGPQMSGMAPALNTFLTKLSEAFAQLMANIGPQLPQIFENLANAFVALLPQLPLLVSMFTRLIAEVGPQLPGLFAQVTDAIEQLMPLMPVLMELFKEFIGVVKVFVELLGDFVNGLRVVNDLVGKDLPQAIRRIWDTMGGLVDDFLPQSEQWGKRLVQGLIRGMLDATGLSGLGNAAKTVMDWISHPMPRSPAKVGPFSGSGYTTVRGRKMIEDMAAGMVSAQGAVESAAASTMAVASSGLSAGGGRAPLPGGLETAGGALLPDNIAGADNSILDAYLRHQFPDNRGLKGLAKDLGNLLSVFQNGFNLAYQQGAQQLLQAFTPFASQQGWRKIPADVLARQQAAEAQRKAFEEQKNPTWGDLGLPQAPSDRTHPTAAGVPGPGNSALEAALRAKGFSDKQIRLIQAFSQVEGNNPAGNPTLGFTDAQLGGATDLQSHVDALAKQFIDRASVAGAFPEGGTDLEQAQWIAKVVGQAGLSADWQGNAQPQDYVQRVLRAMGPAGGNGPSWPQVTGGVPTAGLAIGGWFGAPSPFAGVGTGPSAGVGAPLVQPGVPNLTGLALPDVRGAHSQLALALWAVQQLFPGATLNAGKDDHGIDRGWHPKGQAIDIGFPGNDPQRLAGIAQWLMQFTPDIEQLIFSGPGVSQNILGGKAVPAIDMSGSPYTTGEAGYHGDHVHLAITDQMAQAFAAALGSGAVLPPGAVAGGLGAAAGRGGGQLVLPSGKTVQEVLDSANLSANDRLLQSFLQGNPDLAAQIGAARTPGASDATVLQALTGIDTTISGLKAQDAVGNENTIRALQATQSQIAQSTGFAQGPTSFSQGLQVAQALGGGAANAITGVIQAIQGGLDSLTATQDIADRLVYGVRNTEDVNAIVDDMQKYITFAAQIASATGSILQSIGSVISVAGQAGASATSSGFGGDPGAGVAAVGQAFELAGMISQLVSGALQAVNAAIDFSQQAYHVAGTYFGRLLSNLVAGPGGTPLMGDVRFLLNTNTGQLLSYSRDNPGNQNALAVPGFLNAAYGYGGGNPNPQVNQQLNVYAGPGQPVGEMLREVVWMVNTSGTTGALAPSNF